jgi:hypothetical protein
MSDQAAKAGYDSIQFTGHNDGGTNDKCCVAAGGGKPNLPCHIEIVAVKLVGSYACCDKVSGASLKAGWQGSRACQCTEAAFDGYVNCKGVPMTAIRPDPVMAARIREATARLPANRTHGDLVNAIVAIQEHEFE